MAAFSAEHLTAFSCLANLFLSSFTVIYIMFASGHAAITITTSASTPLGLLVCSLLIPSLSLLHLQLEQVLRRMQPDTLTTLDRHLSTLMLAVPLYVAWFIIASLWTACQGSAQHGFCPSPIPQQWLSMSIAIIGWFIVLAYIIYMTIATLEAKETKRQQLTAELSKEDLDIEVMETTVPEKTEIHDKKL